MPVRKIVIIRMIDEWSAWSRNWLVSIPTTKILFQSLKPTISTIYNINSFRGFRFLNIHIRHLTTSRISSFLPVTHSIFTTFSGVWYASLQSWIYISIKLPFKYFASKDILDKVFCVPNRIMILTCEPLTYIK